MDGWEVTFKNEHYATTRDGIDGAKIWPSTFYGLYDGRFVEKLVNGNYTVSIYGKQQIHKVPDVLETEKMAEADGRDSEKAG